MYIDSLHLPCKMTSAKCCLKSNLPEGTRLAPQLCQHRPKERQVNQLAGFLHSMKLLHQSY